MDAIERVVTAHLDAMREEYQRSRQCDNEEMVIRFKNFQSLFGDEKKYLSIRKQAVYLIYACRILAPAQMRKCESIVKQLWERNPYFRISPDKDPQYRKDQELRLNYQQKIKRPLGLQSLALRLPNYDYLGQFVLDLFTIIRNSMLFNPQNYNQVTTEIGNATLNMTTDVMFYLQ